MARHAITDTARIGLRLPFMQDCHGAPGIVCRFARATWLERAGAFAMHAIGQAELQRAAHAGQARHSLWTGDEGVAVYLHACLSGDTAFPPLDVF